MASPNVFAAFARPVKSVQEYDDEADAREVSRLALQEKRRANALAELTSQQQAADRTALQRYAAESGGDQNKLVAALRGSGSMGLMTQADAIQKAQLELRKADAEVGNKQALTGKTEFETQEGKRKAAIQQVAALNSPDEAIQLLNQQVTAGAIPMQAAQALERMVRSDPKWQVRLVLGINDPKEMLAALQPHMQNAGGALVNTNPLAGPTGQGAPTAIPITQSADNKATQETARRGQNMSDARSREANSLTREANATVYDPDRGLLINKGNGLARPAVSFDGKPIAAKTPESTKKELASIDSQLAVLDGALKDVRGTPGAFSFKRGLATMTGPLTESIAGRLDSSAERDARSYVFNVVSKVINERAGAAQSAQELARLRSFLPAETDNAEQVADKLESFKGYLSDLGNGLQQGRYQPQPKPGAGDRKGPAQIKDDAGYNALPSGALFVGPDGKTRRKP